MKGVIIRFAVAFTGAFLLFMIIPLAGILTKDIKKERPKSFVVELPTLQKKKPLLEKRFEDQKLPPLELSGTPSIVSVKIPEFKPILDNQKINNEGEEYNRIYSESEVDEPVRLISRKNPLYPPEAKRAGITGSVTALLTVDQRGYVKDVKIVSSPSEIFNKSIKETLGEWVFTPAKSGGVAVVQEASITIDFNLEEK